MSYNYEITYDNNKKKSEQSKYIYKNNELDSQTFIFELILKNKMNQNQTIRKIMKSNQGCLISYEDDIKYDIMQRYKLTVIDVNNMNEIIIIKDIIDHSLSTNTFMDEKIYLEITHTNKLLNINYNIL
jgi:hypothetical protein